MQSTLSWTTPCLAVCVEGSNGVTVCHAAADDSRRVAAEVSVLAPLDKVRRFKHTFHPCSTSSSHPQVWDVLTDYERLAEFVPNLESCERLPPRTPGRLLLRQRGCSQAALWRLEAGWYSCTHHGVDCTVHVSLAAKNAHCFNKKLTSSQNRSKPLTTPFVSTEAVLEVWEQPLPMGARALHFSLVEGDFWQFEGRWVVEADPTVRRGMLATLLRYEARLQPKASLPSAIVSQVLTAGLPANVLAIARRAEQQTQRALQVGTLCSCVSTITQHTLLLWCTQWLAC